MKEDTYKLVNQLIDLRTTYNDIICERLRNGVDMDTFTEMCEVYDSMCHAIDRMIKVG